MGDETRVNREKKRFGVLCGITVIAVLIGTLWPFDFFPPNRVSWLLDERGIVFRGAGVVLSEAPLKAANTAEQSCSLELLVQPGDIQYHRTVLSFYTPNDNPRKLLVQQSGKDLLVSNKIVDAQKKLETTEFAVDGVFEQGQLVLLTITSGPHGTLFYNNGRQSASFPRFRIPPTDLSGQIVLATSPVDYQPWEGEIRGL